MLTPHSGFPCHKEVGIFGIVRNAAVMIICVSYAVVLEVVFAFVLVLVCVVVPRTSATSTLVRLVGLVGLGIQVTLELFFCFYAIKIIASVRTNDGNGKTIQTAQVSFRCPNILCLPDVSDSVFSILSSL